MNHHIIDRTTVRIAPLDRATSRLPDLNGPILRARDHPFALTMEGDARYVARMALEAEQRIGVRGFDVIEFDGVVAGGGEESLVRRDTEAIDL
jgi:hypothetical protein